MSQAVESANFLSRSSLSLLGAILVLLFATPTRGLEQVIDSGVAFWQPNNQAPRSYSWLKVVQLMNQNLADASQLNIYSDLCHDGRLIDLQADVNTKLTMPYIAATATKLEEKSKDGSANFDQNPPGRLPVHNNKDEVIPKDFYYSYYAYLAKRVRAAGVPGVKELHDAAVAARVQEPRLTGTPQFKKADGANENLKINAGMTTHDVVFSGDLSGGLNHELQDQMYLALKKLNPTSLKYYGHNFTPNIYNEITVNGNGSAANFETMLGTLKTSLQANPGTGVVNLFLNGHGSVVTKNVAPKPAPMPKQPKQGKQMGPGKTILNISMTPDLWTDLKEEVVQNDSDLVRGILPEFFVSVSEALMPMMEPIGVSIGGISLGDISIPNLSTGGALVSVPLGNSYLSQLIALHDGAPELSIEFDVPDDSWFRLALDDDILYDPLFMPGEVGTGLISYVSGIATPEPSAAVLAVLAMTFLMWFRNRPVQN